MKVFSIFLVSLFTTILCQAQVTGTKISQLPLYSGASVGPNDVFPIVVPSLGANGTQQLKLYDLLNMPPFSTFNAATATALSAVPAQCTGGQFATGIAANGDANCSAPAGSGTVTTVSVVTANGVSGSVANPTTTPAITLTLGAITPSSVAASGTVTGSNLSGTNTGNVTLTAVGAAPSANAATLSGQALTLQPFDGTHPGVVTSSGGGTTNFLRADGSWAVPSGGSSGTVTTVSVVTANGVSGSVANPTTTPAITLTLGAITPSSVAASGTVTGSNLSGSNTGDITLTAFGASPSANGASLSGQALTLQPFDDTHPGEVTASGGGTVNFLRADGTWVAPAGSGTVTTVSVVTANGVSGSVANPTTTPAITLTLGAITPSSVAASGTVTGSNLSGSNTGDITLTAVGAVPNANAATLSGQALTLQPFDDTNPGVVTASGGGTTNFLRADGTWAAPTGGTGTVTTVSVVTANGVSGSVANPTTTPAITLTLGAITPSSVAASGTVTGSNLSGSNTGDITLTAFGASPSADGASLSGQALTLQPFDDTHPGEVTASGGGTTNFLRADGSWAAPTGSGTVTTVSVVTANGVSGSVATATTTPAITLTLGAITPSSVAASGTVTGSNLSGTNTGDITLTAVGASPSANAATLSGQALTLQPFDDTHPGVVTSSGGGTTNFLRADGSWAPSGGGTTARAITANASTTYTFALTDGYSNGNFPLLASSNAAMQTLTIPPNSSVAFPVGEQIDVTQQGPAGLVFTPGAGVTLNSPSGTQTATQFSFTSIIQTATDVWMLVGDQLLGFISASCTSCSISTSGNYHIYTFNVSDTLVITSGSGTVESTVLGGGAGGGGDSGNSSGGGGGAGGYIYTTPGGVYAAGSFPINIGAAGTGSAAASGTSGGNTTFDAITATGGGFGGGTAIGSAVAGANGGSGGGGNGRSTGGAGGTGTGGQGNNGSGGNGTGSSAGGGGGGKGSAAGNSTNSGGGNGGAGIVDDILGDNVAGGGGGGCTVTPGAASFGGGAGTTGGTGSAATTVGSAGGGGDTGGAGFHGRVVLKIRFQ